MYGRALQLSNEMNDCPRTWCARGSSARHTAPVMRPHQLLAACAVFVLTAASSACQSGALTSTQDERSCVVSSAAVVAPAAEPRAPAVAASPALLDAELVAALPPSRAQAVEAEPYPNMYRTFELSLGLAAYDNFDTTMRVTGDSGLGALLDLEDLLGLDEDQSVFRADTFYRFSPRHRLNLSYYDIDRDGDKTIEEDLVIGDVTFPAGSGVATQFDTTILKLSYQYNFVTDLRTAIGASIGLHTMKFDTRFETQSGTFEESFKATAPLPVLGLHAEYALSPKWKLLGSSEFFQIELGDFDGFLADNRLSLEHNLFKHVGWGIGFNSFTLDASVEDDNLTADVEYAFQGLMIYLRAIP